MTKADVNIEIAHTYLLNKDSSNILQDEQVKSITIAKDIIAKLTSEGKKATTCILVDDYNSIFSFDEKNIYEAVCTTGLIPDYIVKESIFSNYADYLVSNLPEKYIQQDNNNIAFQTKSDNLLLWGIESKQDNEDFMQIFIKQTLGNDKGLRLPQQSTEISNFTSSVTLKSFDSDGLSRYACVLLTACWHLSRLGVEPFSEISKKIYKCSENPFFGETILTILPSKYLKIEALARELIGACTTKTISKKKRKMEYIFF